MKLPNILHVVHTICKPFSRPRLNQDPDHIASGKFLGN